MELKPIAGIEDKAGYKSFNRTRMELKPTVQQTKRQPAAAFNRTRMELKLLRT